MSLAMEQGRLLKEVVQVIDVREDGRERKLILGTWFKVVHCYKFIIGKKIVYAMKA